MNGPDALVYPALAQVFWTFIVFTLLGWRRYTAIRDRQVRLREIRLSGEGWPDFEKKAANNLRNQFETPVIFYALCAIAIYVGATGPAIVTFAWGYVASRVGHTAVHTTVNHLPMRALVFAFGAVLLALMWIAIVVHLARG